MTDRPGAVVVSETMARRTWPGEDPIGKTLATPSLFTPRGPVQDLTLRVVGVARDSQVSGPGHAASNQIYLPVVPRYQPRLIKTRADFASVASQIRDIVRELDSQAVVTVTTLGANLAT